MEEFYNFPAGSEEAYPPNFKDYRECVGVRVCVCASACVYARTYVCACMYACVRACVRVCFQQN